MESREAAVWTSLLFGTLFVFLIASLCSQQTISYAERRRLAAFPSFSWKGGLSGEYEACVEEYATDHLSGRDGLLRLDALASSALYLAADQNGFVLKNGSIIEVSREIDFSSLDYAADLFASLYARYLQNSDCRIYFSIVPDKSYFLEKDEYLNMDYEAFFERVREVFSFAQPIDIQDTLHLSDYYASDPHWKQESILDTAKKLASGMHVTLLDSWKEEEVLASFSGQQALRSAYRSDPDALRVLVNEQMKDWTVIRYGENGPEKIEVYDRQKANSIDPYSVFLSGSAGMITIENPDAKTDRELIVFSDSFGSSLTPLLAVSFSKTTLIDLRNLPSWRLSSVIDFENQDVLFLYSTSSLNASQTMR